MIPRDCLTRRWYSVWMLVRLSNSVPSDCNTVCTSLRLGLNECYPFISPFAHKRSERSSVEKDLKVTNNVIRSIFTKVLAMCKL